MGEWDTFPELARGPKSDFYVMVEKFERRGTKLLLSGVQPQPMKVLYNSGFVDKIGIDNVCATIDIALERARVILAGK